MGLIPSAMTDYCSMDGEQVRLKLQGGGRQEWRKK
jgi:hypothetical protein